ncbi:YheC/YheD family protein [Ammoniphilus sp. YIM 78166]|uniref:YheC/YheD family endospore coat-associated protein n=1 Tax=Ammoniphilus sp. YIM 78166 TaxID=1644106 RepID=UPI00106F7B33|nr:YheC/YheD family protein [Ammoniphilus sp. YIM 78166]
MKYRAIIGILTTPGGYDDFRPLFKENEDLGHLIYVFTPKDIMFRKRKIKGHRIREDGSWEQKKFKWPDIVIDKHFETADRLYDHIRKHALLPFTDQLLPGKWEIHNLLENIPSLRKYLPKTKIYSRHSLKKMLLRFPLLYIKPFHGTWGNRILKVERLQEGYLITGRKDGRKIIQRRLPDNKIVSWIDDWVDGIPFIIQQGLDLCLLPERVTDMRILVQKNEYGRWHITGKGMRIGAPVSPTSNLHGGGNAKEVMPILQQNFGRKKALSLLEKSQKISYVIADAIERQYGRMMELGLDLGIDTNGRLWIIEVNDKPGRQIFKKIGRRDLYREANRLPLLYAAYLARSYDPYLNP